MTLHAIGNAHIDPVSLWRWTEGLETIRGEMPLLGIQWEAPVGAFTFGELAKSPVS